MNPYQYGAKNPILLIDVNGDSLGLNYIGSSPRIHEMMVHHMINSNLEGQFVLAETNSGNLTLKQTEEGNFDKLTGQGKEVYKALSHAFGGNRQTSIKVDFAKADVDIGNFSKSTIDVADILQFNKNKTELGGTQIGKLVHEFIEQKDKQEGASGFAGAHNSAIFFEHKVNNSKREDSREFSRDSATQTYTRGNRTVTNRIITHDSKGVRNLERRVLKVQKF